MFETTEPLCLLPQGVETRWASHENQDAQKGRGGTALNGRKGSAWFTLKTGENYTLAHAENTSGTVRRMWITINDRSPEMLRGLRLDFYWDGQEKPAVSAPIGDFFGVGLGRTAVFESALFSNPEGRSFNSFIPMPFRKGMKLVLTNETEKDLAHVYYDVNYTIGDQHSENVMYFHAHYRRENPTTTKKDYEILPFIQGRGRYLGTNIGVKADQDSYFQTWWGEGEVKIYLDGDRDFPTLCGTGAEDYIGSAWGQGIFSNMYQGCTVYDHDSIEVCFYRYHIPDPVYFYKDIRVTIQQIGNWDTGDPKVDMRPFFHYHKIPVYSNTGELLDFSKDGVQKRVGLFERADDWSSCVYFYLDSPTNSLLPIDPFPKRIP